MRKMNVINFDENVINPEVLKLFAAARARRKIVIRIIAPWLIRNHFRQIRINAIT
jgi:hypothetical protein